MVDFAPEYAVGEDIDGNFNGGSLKKPVEYTATVAIGNPLKAVGASQSTDNITVVKSNAAADATRFIAILNGDDGDVKEALLRGTTKVEIGTGGATAGESAEILTTGTFKDIDAGSKVGFFLQSGLVGDFVLMYFDGVQSN